MPNTILALSAVVGVVGTVQSANARREASRDQERQQTLSTRRSRRQAIRQRQLAQAQAIASAQGSGSLDSSGAAGGIQSLSSQLGEGLGFSTQMSGLSQRIGLNSRRATAFNSIANLGFQGSQFALRRGASLRGIRDQLFPPVDTGESS